MHDIQNSEPELATFYHVQRKIMAMSSTFRCCLILPTLAAPAYAQNAIQPEFEVASVKPSDPSNNQVS